jgi:hypothetical protein
LVNDAVLWLLKCQKAQRYGEEEDAQSQYIEKMALHPAVLPVRIMRDEPKANIERLTADTARIDRCLIGYCRYCFWPGS